mmetsp:Transcript_10873/g.17815  ORF Transcript_10873/g.17815 Transcript_10873/m.17815 type:complete len:172 (-) Transcript_10873:324-839(-)
MILTYLVGKIYIAFINLQGTLEKMLQKVCPEEVTKVIIDANNDSDIHVEIEQKDAALEQKDAALKRKDAALKAQKEKTKKYKEQTKNYKERLRSMGIPVSDDEDEEMPLRVEGPKGQILNSSKRYLEKSPEGEKQEGSPAKRASLGYKEHGEETPSSSSSQKKTWPSGHKM